MRVELLYFDSCPSYRVAEERLREVLAEANVADPIRLIEISTAAAAWQWKFPGSPTIRFDGVDPFEQGEPQYGLECRVYLTPDGFRGSPTKHMLREALDKMIKAQDERMLVHPV